MSTAMELNARVALHWKVKCEINGKVVSEKNIGTVREDQKNNITTFTYVGLELRPGPNTIRVVAISPQGATGAGSGISRFSGIISNRCVGPRPSTINS